MIEKKSFGVFLLNQISSNINDEIYLSKDLRQELLTKFKNNLNNYEIKFNCDLKNFYKD